MGKTTETCTQIVIPGVESIGSTGLEVPVAASDVAFTGPVSSLKLDELVVPFHAWGSFFDVAPGQSVRIEAPEDKD